MSIKLERVQSIIMKNVSSIIQMELRDPNIGFVTITDVSLTNDYSYATIYVTFLDNRDQNKQLEALNHAKSLIRSKLSKTLDIRKTPDLIFKLDKSLEKGNRIDQIIRELNN